MIPDRILTDVEQIQRQRLSDVYLKIKKEAWSFRRLAGWETDRSTQDAYLEAAAAITKGAEAFREAVEAVVPFTLWYR